tara:strand:+ start:47 stop:328 length:282 start_codon:yes stop_codon:yes gene_type:complete
MSLIDKETEDLGKDIKALYEKTYHLVHKGMEQHKAMHDINTFYAHENEVCLRGKDEMGEDFSVVFPAFDFLQWIDKEQIDYIKEQVTKYIKTK